MQLTAAVVLPTDNRARDIAVAWSYSAGYGLVTRISDNFPPADTPITVGIYKHSRNHFEYQLFLQFKKNIFLA